MYLRVKFSKVHGSRLNIFLMRWIDGAQVMNLPKKGVFTAKTQRT